MKAITIWQPWASLIACGAKQYETRSWATNYRGEIAIHAALTPIHKIMNLIPWETINAMMDVLGFKDEFRFNELPRGCVIATAELVGCHEMVLYGGRGMSRETPGWLETENGIYEPTDLDLMFGDWAPGRYAWELANVQLLSEPVPTKGRQGLWEWNR